MTDKSAKSAASKLQHDIPVNLTTPTPYIRLGITGIFMGLANLVPGVSGGTMVLALGLYEEFIEAFSELTRFRFTLRAIVVVAMLFGIAALTIFALAGAIQFLMETYLPGMLALFIGMTLGGVPLLWREIKPLKFSSVAFTILAFLFMAWIAFGLEPDLATPSWFYLFLGGVVGSSAMILPGISGSYMLLIMGLYLPIIGAVSAFKGALSARDLAYAFELGLQVLLPVALGLAVGIVILSNLLKVLLERFHKPTIGLLMGLLLGSVLGLYPFEEPSFDKLPRYAVESPEGSKELRILAFGWKESPESTIYQNLKAIEGQGIRLRIHPVEEEESISPVHIEAARREKAVLVAYDIQVPKEVRREAARPDREEVILLIVPNTEFSAAKGIFALIAIAIGFTITFAFGRWGELQKERERRLKE